MKTAHTPTPWHLCDSGNRVLSKVKGFKPSPQHPEYVVAQVGIYVSGDKDTQAANAALIVKAVNERDELIDALEAVYADWKAIADAEQYRDKNIDALVMATLKTAKGE